MNESGIESAKTKQARESGIEIIHGFTNPIWRKNMALPKWTDERTEALTTFVGNESPVSQATVAEAAEALETSARSVSSKLRKMGLRSRTCFCTAGKSFTEDQEATLSPSLGFQLW